MERLSLREAKELKLPLNPFKKSKIVRELIEANGSKIVAEVDFDPIGPTAVYGDELLSVHAPFFPLVGRRALINTVVVLQRHEDDKILRKAVKEESQHLRITRGQQETLRRAAQGEE